LSKHFQEPAPDQVQGPYRQPYLSQAAVSILIMPEHRSLAVRDGQVIVPRLAVFVEGADQNQAQVGRLGQEAGDRLGYLARILPQVKPLQANDLAGVEGRWSAAM
jgi:hypothetical protein